MYMNFTFNVLFLRMLYLEFTVDASSIVGLLSEGVDLSGIGVLEADRRTIAQAKIEVNSLAQKMLASGMSTLVKTDISTYRKHTSPYDNIV